MFIHFFFFLNPGKYFTRTCTRVNEGGKGLMGAFVVE